MSKAKRQVEIICGYKHEQRYFINPNTINSRNAELQVLSSPFTNFIDVQEKTTFIALQQENGWQVYSSQPPSYINPFHLSPENRNQVSEEIAYLVFPILERHKQKLITDKREQFLLL